MEQNVTHLSKENTKEEGELSDEDEGVSNKSRPRLRNGSSGSKSGRTSTHFTHSNWSRYKAETKLNVSRNISESQKLLPRPNHVLPPLMELKPRPSKNFNPFPNRPFNNTPRIYHSNIPGNAFSNSAYQSQNQPPVSASPASRLWENRRKRSSKEDSEKKTDEDDFETLLKKYKDIQGQLADIKKEEEIFDSCKTLDKDSSISAQDSSAATENRDKELDSMTLDSVPSPVISERASPVIQLDSSPQTDGQLSSQNKIEADDEDEELDELELRRIALASAAEKMRLAEVDENSNPDKQSPTSNEKHKIQSNNASPKTFRPSTKESKSSNLTNRNKNSKMHPRFLRARTPAIRSKRLAKSPRQASDIRPRDNRLPRPAAGSRTRQNYSRKPRSADTEEKNKDVSSEKTREIQKILLLDDPEEQVARFLALVNKTGQADKKAKTQSQTGRRESLEQSKDNYEEVEMDIDSDADSQDVSNPVEELFEPDFYSAMQPMYIPSQPVYDSYDPVRAWGLPVASYSATNLAQYPPNPAVDHSVAPSLSDGQLMAGYLMPENLFPHTASVEFTPPPPPPDDPPPAMPPLPPSQPPLPTSPPLPPLPSEPPPPPPPPDIPLPEVKELPKPKPRSLEEQIEAMIKTYSDAAKLDQKQPETLQSNKFSLVVSESLPKLEGSHYPSYTPSSVTQSEYKHDESKFVTANNTEWNGYTSNKNQHVEIEVDGEKPAQNIDIKVIVTTIPSTTTVQESKQVFTAISPAEQEEDDGEEEEALLRARLLQSLAARKKEKDKQEDIPRSESSPSLSRSQSPSTPYTPSRRIIQQTAYPKIHLGNLPTQKPVVIRLGEDSSDEEGESKHLLSPPRVEKYLGGLDTFLKEARRSSEVNTDNDNHQATSANLQMEAKRRAEAAAKVRQLEADLIKCNERITKDQGLLKMLVTRASKYLQNVKVTEQKIRLLTEQLAAAEKLVTANKGALLKAKTQAGLVKDGLLKKKKDYEAMQRVLLELGRGVHGPDYKIGLGAIAGRRVEIAAAQPSRRVPKKTSQNNRMNEIKITIDNTDKKTANPVKQKMSSEEIIQEKARLQKLAKEYEKKIQLLKNSTPIKKMLHTTGSSATNKQVISKAEQVQPEMMSHNILKLEKIELDSDPIDLTSDTEKEGVKRRRSLMEMNPSTRPDLIYKATTARQNSREEKENDLEIPIPDSKSVLKLLRMQKNQFEEQLQQCSQQSLSSLEDQPYAALYDKPQQIAKLTAYKGAGKIQASPNSARSPDFQYRSPLLHFRSYRFSPYFRTRALRQLKSKSIAHKILPKKKFCRFDLKGTCNDEKCNGQHQDHYTMSDREILLDIVSYFPALAGVQNAMPAKKIPKVMGDYVDTLMKQNQGRLTLDEQCLLLISKVNERAKHVPPHTMFFSSRLFRPSQEEKPFDSSDVNFKGSTGEEFVWKTLGTTSRKMEENILLEGDRRYFYTDGTCEVQDLETAVLTNSKDTQLWLKLASKKLHNPKLPPERCLDEALNALARGLEENSGSSDLWLEYLTLYARHPQATDYTHLCQTAIHYAPSFQIYWLFLHSLASYTDRNEVCSEVVDYLCTVQTPDKPDLDVSHHLLEAMLYKVHLSIMAGQRQYAKNILQGYLVKSEGRPAVQSRLVPGDRAILWLCYIHLQSWNELPAQLWEPANQMSGKIVNKKLVLPWDQLSAPDFTGDQQVALLEEAIKVCVGETTPDDTDFLQDCMVLYKNLIQLLKSLNKLGEVLTVCRDLLQRDQSLADIWLLVANLYVSNGETQATSQVFNEAMEVNPMSAKVFNFAANFEISQKTDGAMKILEGCPCGFFVDGDKLNDPQSLYCVLLKQTLPIGYKVPEYRPEVSDDIVARQLAYLWLNYCLFLEQQGDYATVVEMYETALCALSEVKGVTKIWNGYLQFQYRQILQYPDAEVHCQQLNQLFHRCMVTVPVKVPMPHWPNKAMENYRHINKIIDLYLQCTIPENRPLVLDKLISMMPNNVELVIRCCLEWLRMGDNNRALSVCYPLLHDPGCASSQLWQLALSLASKQSHKLQVRKLYHQAVQRMPYDLSLWKNFLISEMARGDAAKEMIKAIVLQCQMLGLNTGELIQLLKAS